MNTDLNILTIPKILETFDKFTTLKATSLLKDFSIMTTEGKVIDVVAGENALPGVVAVTLRPLDAPEHRPFEVRCEFQTLPETEIYQCLMGLAKGARLKVSGKIVFTTARNLTLGGCTIEL